MQDSNEMFRKVFDNSDIVKKWEEIGFDHVGTIFSQTEGGIIISFDVENDNVEIDSPSMFIKRVRIIGKMLDLIYETRQYIINLAATCDALCSKID